MISYLVGRTSKELFLPESFIKGATNSVLLIISGHDQRQVLACWVKHRWKLHLQGRVDHETLENRLTQWIKRKDKHLTKGFMVWKWPIERNIIQKRRNLISLKLVKRVSCVSWKQTKKVPTWPTQKLLKNIRPSSLHLWLIVLLFYLRQSIC